MFMVLSSWQSLCESSPVHLMNVEWRQAAADPTPCQTTWTVSLPVYAARVYTHHCHLL